MIPANTGQQTGRRSGLPSIVISLWNKGIKLWDESPNPLPLRQMPDGRVGAVYKGRVYPLRGQNEIDISDPWEDPNDCPLVPDTTDVIRPWFLDTSGRSTYLVWRGRQSQVDDVITALKSAGIQVRQHGPSKKLASNGISYDWWVRLPDNDTPSEEQLDRAFQSIEGTAPQATKLGIVDSDVVTISKAELDKFQSLVEEQTTLLQQTLKRAATAEATIDAFGNRYQQQGRELAEAKAELDSQKKLWESERGGLLLELQQAAKQIAALRVQPKTGPKPMDIQLLEDQRRKALEREQAALAERDRVAQEIAKVLAVHSDCGPLLTDIGNENTALKTRNAALDAAVAQLRVDVERLQSEAAVWRVQAQAKSPDAARFVASLHQIRSALLPSIIFINDIESILLSIANVESLFAVLREIESRAAKGRQIAGADDWYDTHFSTGNDDDGRVYWRQAGQVRYVLVGFKDGQQGDIAKLRRWRPPN
jgi:hypothetical protein